MSGKVSAVIGLRQENRFEVMRKIEVRKASGGVIGKLASSHYAVLKNARVSDLAQDFDHHPEIPAVGVINEKGEVLGIVVRKELFDILSKPYGRDILTHKTVMSVARYSLSFLFDRNIFSVSEALQNELTQRENSFYLLLAEGNHYYGCLAGRDILIYLSQITQTDINLAREIQRNMVPEENFVTAGKISIAAASRMAKGVGGDFYDIRPVGGNKILVSLCDVSGKGISASLVTTSLGGMFQMADFSKGSADFLKRINRYLFQSFEIKKYVTGVFLELDVESGEVCIFDMGHSLITLIDGGKLFRVKTSHENRPLGIQPELEPVPDRLRFSQGARLILATDGILEQTDSGGEEYGEERFSRMILQNQKRSISVLRDNLLLDLHLYRGTQTQIDDMTLVILQFGGKSQASFRKAR